MYKFLSRMSAAAVLLAASGSAFAVTTVPEPGILELVGVAAVVGLIARKMRK